MSHEAKKCVSCHDFFQVKFDKCSFCFETSKYDQVDMKLLCANPHPAIFQPYFKNHYKEMFETMCFPYKVLDEEKFALFRANCTNKTPEELMSYFLGINNPHEHVALEFKQAQELIDSFGKYDFDNNSPYINVIAAFLIKPWECSDLPLFCYYYPDDMPLNMEQLQSVWNNFSKYQQIHYKLQTVDLGECCICLDDISTDHDHVRCTFCKIFLHQDCVKITNNCPSCTNLNFKNSNLYSF